MYNPIVQNYKRELNETYARELDNFTVIEDKGYGAIPTFIKCMCNDDGNLLYFEDDVILCHNFKEKVNQAIKELGDDKVIQFFNLKKSISETKLMTGSTYCQNQCFYMPSKMRVELVKYFNEVWSKSQCFKDNPTAMDYLVRDFLKDNKYKYWIYQPCLVQHQIGKSVIDPRRSTKRLAKHFIDEEEKHVI